jgi:hypothetical protein
MVVKLIMVAIITMIVVTTTLKTKRRLKNKEMKSNLKFYRKRPEVIQALQYDGKNVNEIASLMKVDVDSFMIPSLNEYIVKYSDGVLEIFTEQAFNKTFEKVG